MNILGKSVSSSKNINEKLQTTSTIGDKIMTFLKAVGKVYENISISNMIKLYHLITGTETKNDLFNSSQITSIISPLVQKFLNNVNSIGEFHLYDPSGSPLLKPALFNYSAYNYAGPGTLVEKRIEMGQNGINMLDAMAKEHDKIYFKTSGQNNNPESVKLRRIYDEKLKNTAEKFVRKSSSFLDILNGLIVYYSMSYKLNNNIF